MQFRRGFEFFLVAKIFSFDKEICESGREEGIPVNRDGVMEDRK